MSYYSQVRVCSLSAGGSAGACVMAAPCDVSPSTGGPSHDGASLCATTSSGSPTASRRDAPTVSRGRPRWTIAAASRQPALHTPKVVACETCQRPVSVLAATMPARRAKHVTTPMPVGCQQEGGGGGGVEGWRNCMVYGNRLWRWRSQLQHCCGHCSALLRPPPPACTGAASLPLGRLESGSWRSARGASSKPRCPRHARRWGVAPRRIPTATG